MKKILIIEDEKDLADLLAFNLEKEGFQPVCAYDGTGGLAAARAERPDLIILDLMLPGMMGTDICRELRRDSVMKGVSILMLTARSEEIDRVVGFEVGADDYLAKPFSMRELILRVKAVLRRSTVGDTAPKGLIAIGCIAIDSERHAVICDGRPADLTSTEYRLLSYLAARPNRVVSRELLLQQVWGYNYLGDTRTVDTHITRLRSKLGAAGDQIKTVRGFGYKIEATP
jgi:two-component system, OmpR family, phosphate regulon response regulator PhoB